MNSTETPGGSGIPAGWYDDPSGQGLRWWDGEQWTEHVHTAESAAAAVAAGTTEGGGEREAPPPDLVRLRESIRRRGAKGVGMVLGALVLVILVVALLASGGSESKGGSVEGGSVPSGGSAGVTKAEIGQLQKELKNQKLPKAEKKQLEAELKKLEKQAGKSGGKNAKGEKSAQNGSGKGKKSSEEGG